MNENNTTIRTIPELLERATRPGATPITILSPQPLSIVQTTLTSPADAEAYFAALLATTTTTQQPPILSPRAAVGVLAAPSHYFRSGDAKMDESERYLKAIAIHVEGLVESMRNGSEQRFVVDILQAAGSSATRLPRPTISSSGIIPALTRLCSSPPSSSTHVLTSAHPEFLQICLLAGHYSHACRFADERPIFAVSPYRSTVSPEAYLRYFYLLGVVRLGCRRYRDAIRAFEVGITMPSQIVSAIQIAARKKMLLAKCLLEDGDDGDGEEEGEEGDAAGDGGTTGRLPKWRRNIWAVPTGASPSVVRFFNGAETASEDATTGMAASADVAERSPGGGASAGVHSYYYGLELYNDLVLAFLSLQTHKFNKMMEDMTCLLASDGNLGLAKQLSDELLPRQIRKLAKVYSTIPLDKLAKKIGLSSVRRLETILLAMISKRDTSFSAKIDHDRGIVRFPRDDDEEQPEDPDLRNERHHQLLTSMKQCMELAHRVKKLDITLTTSQKYQSLVQKDAGKMGGQPRGVAELGRAAAAVEGFD